MASQLKSRHTAVNFQPRVERYHALPVSFSNASESNANRRPVRTPYLSRWLESIPPKKLLGRDDRDFLIPSDCSERPIAGDDRFGVQGDGAGHEFIVVGVLLDHHPHFEVFLTPLTAS